MFASTHQSIYRAEIYAVLLKEKQVNQQNSTLNSMGMLEPGPKENQ